MRSIRTVLTVVCLATALRGTGTAQVVPASPTSRADRLRGLRPEVRALIDDGRRQSSGFARLLQAIEIAAAPEVTDAASLARHYQQHRQRVSRDEYCNRAAQRVANAVRLEIGAAARNRRSSAGPSPGHRSSRLDP